MSLDREASFLCSVVVNEQGNKLDLVPIEAIRTNECRRIYKAIERLNKDGETVDLISVSNQAKDLDLAYVGALFRDAETKLGVDRYASIINREHHLLTTKKRLGELAESIDVNQSFSVPKLSADIAKVLGDVEVIQSINDKKELSIGSSGFDKQVDWLVKGHIPVASFGYVYGASGSYKSFCLLDMMCSLSTGEKWFNNPVKKSAVLYIAAEGASGLRRRIKAWEIKHKKKINNLAVHDAPLILDDKDGQLEILRMCDALKEQTGLDVGAVCIDTLARCYAGSENDNSEMNKFIQACDRIKDATGAAIIAVHHSGKDLEKGARGASSLRAAADFEFRVTRPKGTKNKFQLECTKQKDADETGLAEFNLSIVELGIKDKDDGSPITNLVLSDINYNPATNAHADLLEMKKESGRGGKGAKHAETLLDVISNKYKKGEQFPRDFVRDEFFAVYRDINPQSRRMIFKRAFENLIGQGDIVKAGNLDGYYMLTPDNFNAMENF